jgi:hypothetical protein
MSLRLPPALFLFSRERIILKSPARSQSSKSPQIEVVKPINKRGLLIRTARPLNVGQAKGLPSKSTRELDSDGIGIG